MLSSGIVAPSTLLPQHCTPFTTVCFCLALCRGPSAILLHLPRGAYMMVDCGEGTWGGLVRSSGLEGAAAVVRRMSLAARCLQSPICQSIVAADSVLVPRCLGTWLQVSGLCCIWLSHKHADHVLGLEQILSNRPPDSPVLLVVGPREVGR